MVNKILTTSFVLGTLVFTNVNAIELKGKQPDTKIQQKLNAGKPSKEEFMKKMDKDGNGIVSKKEYKKFLEEDFAEIDKDGDGILTKEEFVIKGKKNKKTGKVKECPCRGEKAFESLDKDADGKLTKKEFKKGKMEQFKEKEKAKKEELKKAKEEEMKKAKAELDKNKVDVKKDEVKVKKDLKK